MMAGTTERTRSPNYPVISLGEAITRMRVIYNEQHMYPTNREVLAKLLGYGGVNGASAGVLSALGKYGLLEGHGDNLKVSSLGQDLCLHDPGESEYVSAIQKAAFTPTLFRELREQYPNGLPSEHSLRVSLIKNGFNPKSVDGVIRVYRDTLTLINAHNDRLESDPTNGETGDPEVRSGAQGRAPASGDAAYSGAAQSGDPRMRSIQLPYSVTEWATLQAAFPLTEEAWDQMLAVLTAMKPALVSPHTASDSSFSDSE